VGAALGLSLLFEHYGFGAPAAVLLAISVALATWYAGRGPALLSLVLAALSMNYFLMEPRRSFAIAETDLPYYLTAVALSALVWWFGTVRRRVEADLRRARATLRLEVEARSSLLDLTHDSIFVRDMDFVITYWNRGAEQFYHWKQ
jgi:K+-sensing histidine kinase KdpD